MNNKTPHSSKNIELVSYHFDHKLGRSIANADWPDQPWQLLKKRPSSMNLDMQRMRKLSVSSRAVKIRSKRL